MTFQQSSSWRRFVSCHQTPWVFHSNYFFTILNHAQEHKRQRKKEVDHIVSDFEENQHFSAANYPDWRELESLPAREDEYKKYNSKIPSRFATGSLLIFL